MNLFMEVVFFPTRADEVRGLRARHERSLFPDFASLRLCAFAFLSYRLPTALCAPLCSLCLCGKSAYWETVCP